jgi:hypothetical protein
VRARADRLQHQLSARLGRRGDGDSVHARRDERGLRVEGRDARVVPGQLGTPLGRAGDHADQFHIRGGDDERRVEEPTAEAVSDQTQPHVTLHHFDSHRG